MDLLQELEQLESTKQTIVEQWNKTGLLQKINNEEAKAGTAVLMENQRLYNEGRTKADNDNEVQFKRLSIPLVRRIAPYLAWEFVSVQPLFLKKDSYYYFEGNKLTKAKIEAKEYKMKCIWNMGQQDLRVSGIDAEAEMVAVMAQDLTMEYNRRIFNEIHGSAAIRKSVDFDDLYGHSTFGKLITLQQAIADLAEEVRITSKRGTPTWICTSPEIADAISMPDKEYGWNGSFSFQRYGVLEAVDGSNITVWSDPLAKMERIILGYKGEHEYDTGYVFCPHRLVDRMPTILDPDSFNPTQHMSSTYGAVMTDPTCYAVLEVVNFIT